MFQPEVFTLATILTCNTVGGADDSCWRRNAPAAEDPFAVDCVVARADIGCRPDERNREKTRIEACDKCRGYLKGISSFSPTPADMLAIEDLATLPLDDIAGERG